MPHQRTILGFTLVEMSIVLAIIGVVLGGSIALFSAGLTRTQYNVTISRMNKIQQALNDFRLSNNRLPCPYDSSVNQTSSTKFGLESTDTGTCSTNTERVGANVSYGGVPVFTLNLPYDMAFDGWGRRINYAVSVPLTSALATGAFYPTASPATDTTTRIIVRNYTTLTALTDKAAYVIISHGPNGHGGRSDKAAVVLSTANTSTPTLLNCKCDSNGAYDATQTLTTYVQGEQYNETSLVDIFDDIVMFATRVQLRSATE